MERCIKIGVSGTLTLFDAVVAVRKGTVPQTGKTIVSNWRVTITDATIVITGVIDSFGTEVALCCFGDTPVYITRDEEGEIFFGIVSELVGTRELFLPSKKETICDYYSE